MLNIEDRVKFYLEDASKESKESIEDSTPQVFFFKRDIGIDVDVLGIVENFDMSFIPQESWNEAIFDFSQGLKKEGNEFDGFVFHAIASESNEEDRIIVFIYSYEHAKKTYTSYSLNFEEKLTHESFLNFDSFNFKYGSVIN